MLGQLGLAGVKDQVGELGLFACGLVLAFVGLFGPIATVESGEDDFTYSVSSSATDWMNYDEGKLILLTIVLSGWGLVRLADARRPEALLGMLVAGLIVLGININTFVGLNDGLNPGWGLIVTGLGGIAMTVGALMIANVRSVATTEPGE